jgi:putative transposase
MRLLSSACPDRRERRPTFQSGYEPASFTLTACVLTGSRTISSHHQWKAKYGGLDVSEARRLKMLTDENAKLKKLLAEAMLDNAMLKDLNAKKW